jgi:hypothetical protein
LRDSEGQSLKNIILRLRIGGIVPDTNQSVFTVVLVFILKPSFLFPPFLVLILIDKSSFGWKESTLNNVSNGCRGAGPS